jgi:hypothetical protein
MNSKNAIFACERPNQREGETPAEPKEATKKTLSGSFALSSMGFVALL